MTDKRATAPAGPQGNGSSRTRQRQRQRLIDACISALHLYGPSRTTVEKVVALADLSPGIVRFYFDSKAAMLVASLAYLAAEFEECVLEPVRRIRERPVEALTLLVELYLGPQIASPRKVSVWYAFWGESSARQEYQDICGKKDEEFAALVRELIDRLIGMTGAHHLDADGVALGLIGALDVLWQSFAFQSEASIDRAAAIARTLRYLRSVFPGEFAAAVPRAPPADAAVSPMRLPARAYADAELLARERERLLRPAWQVIGHEAELRAPGDFLTGEIAGERVVVVRGERGRLQALRNTCRCRPHALIVPRKGHLRSAIHCASHGLTYGFDGRLVAGSTPGDLVPLGLRRAGPLLLVRAMPAEAAVQDAEPQLPDLPFGQLVGFVPRVATDLELAADWKVVVEQWLEAPAAAQRYAAPNLLCELREEGAQLLQVSPLAPGRSRIRRFEWVPAAAGNARQRRERAAWQRRAAAWLREQAQLAESTHAGITNGAGDPAEAGHVSPAVAAFRGTIAALLPAPGA